MRMRVRHMMLYHPMDVRACSSYQKYSFTFYSCTSSVTTTINNEVGGYYWLFAILTRLLICNWLVFKIRTIFRLRSGLKHLALYGTMPQMRRMAVYDEFCAKEHCVLFATDIAARYIYCHWYFYSPYLW